MTQATNVPLVPRVRLGALRGPGHPHLQHPQGATVRGGRHPHLLLLPGVPPGGSAPGGVSRGETAGVNSDVRSSSGGAELLLLALEDSTSFHSCHGRGRRPRREGCDIRHAHFFTSHEVKALLHHFEICKLAASG
jgi:hypothetical protein